MRKTISLILVLALGLCLCACTNTKKQEESIAKEQAEAMDFTEQVIGCWEYLSGWAELGDVIEIYEDGTCLVNGVESKWETERKIKSGYLNGRDYINIYNGDAIAYEAYVNIWDDGTISLVACEANDAQSMLLPNGIYVKADDHNHDHG